jgi:hypothetical protein
LWCSQELIAVPGEKTMKQPTEKQTKFLKDLLRKRDVPFLPVSKLSAKTTSEWIAFLLTIPEREQEATPVPSSLAERVMSAIDEAENGCSQ